MTEMEQFPLFTYVELETASMCNRRCPTCIRQSHPDQESMRPWHEHNLMPIETIHAVFAELGGMGFRGIVNLSHFNEPLLDTRMPRIVADCKQMVPHAGITLFSNGDLLTPDFAHMLNGIVDQMVIALYDADPAVKAARQDHIEKMMPATILRFTDGIHYLTHWQAESFKVAVDNIEQPCNEPMIRLTLNHRGEMMLCCEDIPGHFNLGSFPDKTLVELWNSHEHVAICDTLAHSFAGRRFYPLCRSCPRKGKGE
jgi:hypothetical protein